MNWNYSGYFKICFDVEGKFRKICRSEVHHVCILTSYKGYQDLLEFKEEELILLQDEIQGLNDALMHSY